MDDKRHIHLIILNRGEISYWHGDDYQDALYKVLTWARENGAPPDEAKIRDNVLCKYNRYNWQDIPARP